jgi:hypothetical protein
MISGIDEGTPAAAGVSVERVAYRGWSDSYRISNGVIEATVVPAIGRIMQLSLVGDATGAIWRNPDLEGQLHNPASVAWDNFGGDKCWPAPQSAWGRQAGRDWPPPVAFDSRPLRVDIRARGVALTSPVDPGYGIEIERLVELEPGRPVMHVRTTYAKRRGDAVQVGVWTITQMPEPERMFMQVPAATRFAKGYQLLRDTEPAALRVEGGLLSLGRDHRCETKLGTDGGGLVWVGENCVVRMDAETGPGEYPDGGCVTEIYTNPDPLAYVELETMGPLATLEVGASIARTTVYAVFPRSLPDAVAEARKAFAH